MEVETVSEVSSLVAAAAAAAVAEAPEAVIQPLFTDAIESVMAEAEAEAEEEAEEEDSSEENDQSSVSATSSVEQGLNSAPAEMRQWMEEIDNIEYHYRHDDDDRGYNFFRDNAGSTLMIQEFDINGTRYMNINREIIIKYNDFFKLLDATRTDGGVLITNCGQRILNNCSTDLLVEALTILAENGSDTSSESESESQPELEPETPSSPIPIPTKGDADAIQRFLFSCFLVMVFLKFFGYVTKFA